MAVSIFNHERARSLGFEDISAHGQYPAECWDTGYQGAVLELYERNGHDDSDFYAIVWDEAEGRTKHICYATTRGWTYLDGALVDASEEVKAKALEYWRATTRAALEAATKAALRQPNKGCRAVVARGRKVPRGFEGEVLKVWKEPKRYGYPRREETWVQIANEQGCHRVLAQHLDVIPDPSREARVLAETMAAFDRRPYAPPNWRSAEYGYYHYMGVRI